MTGSPRDPADFETLADWVDGRLPPEQAEAVAAQVAPADPRTRATVGWLRGFVGLGRRFPLEQVPPIVRQRVQASFAQWRDTERGLAEEIRRFDATVAFDSRSHRARAGTRGAAAHEVLHLAYTTAAADLVLDVQRLSGHRVRIDGQVLLVYQSQASVFEATVSGPGFSLRTVDGDRLGRFRLDVVPDDADNLLVTNGEITVSAALELRPGT